MAIRLCTIKVANENISTANKLGEGGFGAVYKGRFPNGQEIAGKMLSRESGQEKQELKNEVLLVAMLLQHRNLVIKALRILLGRK
ncbi:cysteine-rich receptor-like protein kinase 29 [Alnus glutinosa]|uniref:cysteine-rich receptor-like protein kinase 29 n=1 Tax=Alnus glutinosa TaxID=3517 RepID=UPI002D77825E|nr:cysteine-rich receptor-like protein kinase 29 [Alnus glutinosa]